MRTISSNMLNAVLGEESSTMYVKGVIDPTRIFFANCEEDEPYPATDYGEITDTPTGQCVIYSQTLGKAVTVIVDPDDGTIGIMVQGSSQIINPTISSQNIVASKYTKPAAYESRNYLVLVYWSMPTVEIAYESLRYAHINLNTWVTDLSGEYGPEDNQMPNGRWSILRGSPTIINSTKFVFVYETSRGGLGVAVYDTGEWRHWDGRFMSPATITNNRWSIYTTAVDFNNKTFIYATDLATGEVKGLEYENKPNNYYYETPGRWSDTFIAMPADLCRFCIGNAVVSNNYIHIAGQFHRTEDITNGKIYSLVLRSVDGRVFSWDRFTLLSTLGYQFQIALDNTYRKIYASDRNRVGIVDMSCFFHNNPPNRFTVEPPNDIVSFNMSNINNASLKLASYNESLIDHPAVKKGNRVQIFFGYKNPDNSVEYVLYQTYIIDQKSKGFRAGTRLLQLGLTDMGTWLTDQIAFPFYAEIISKVSYHDDADQADHLYPVKTVATASTKIGNKLFVDFWGNKEWNGETVVTGVPFSFRQVTGLACERKTHTEYQDATDALLFRTIDLNEHEFITSYPEIDGNTMTINLFGWSRTNETARPGSSWHLYIITAPENNLDSKTVTEATLTSTYRKFPRDYPTPTQAGSYPITYSISGLTAGDKLLYFGLQIRNTVAGTSESCPERIVVTSGLKFQYSQLTTERAWTPELYAVGTDEMKLKMPSDGLPSVLFALKPYSSFNFNVYADFEYQTGSYPLSEGNTSYGVVGLAEDGLNYVCARYLKQANKIQLIKMRNGIELELASLNFYTTPTGIMLDHRNGKFSVFYKSSSTWFFAFSYWWHEGTDGPLSTSATNIMHVGIYGAVAPPSFLCPGFSIADADGIGIITIDNETTINDFPPSGIVSIDGVKYSYTGKVNLGKFFGPYQGRQTSDLGSYVEGITTFSGMACEIGLYKPLLAHDYVANGLLSASNGHTWQISKTDWTVIHYNETIPINLRDRSRHYADSASGNYVGTQVRTVIGSGLLDISQIEPGYPVLHPYGSLVSLYGSDSIFLKRFVASSADAEATVKDMVGYLCKTASTYAEFPGDKSWATFPLSSTPAHLGWQAYSKSGGFDIQFTIPVLSVVDDDLPLDVVILEVAELDPGITGTTPGDVKLTMTCFLSAQHIKEYIFTVESTSVSPSFPAESIRPHIYSAGEIHVRLFLHDEFISIYINNACAATFALPGITWPKYDYQDIRISTGIVGLTLTNLLVTELYDWREAIYIESEISAQSALGSVIQERPIEVGPTPLGGLQFSYNILRDWIQYDAATSKKMLHSHFDTESTSKDSGSDALVYFRDVTFATYDKFAENEGFLTRVYKLSNLDNGADQAAQILLEKAYENQFRHSFVMRPDPRPEIGDIFTVNYIVPGTEREVTVNTIIEDISIEIQEGRYIMAIQAREDK